MTSTRKEGSTVEEKTADVYLKLPSEIAGLEEALFRPDGTVLLLSSDGLGDGSDELGRRLMEGFLAVLAEAGGGLKALVLINRGVLLGQESPARDSLEALEKQGTAIMVCSVSARHYGIVPLVGQRTTLFRISQVLLGARKVISL